MACRPLKGVSALSGSASSSRTCAAQLLSLGFVWVKVLHGLQQHAIPKTTSH